MEYCPYFFLILLGFPLALPLAVPFFISIFAISSELIHDG